MQNALENYIRKSINACQSVIHALKEQHRRCIYKKHRECNVVYYKECSNCVNMTVVLVCDFNCVKMTVLAHCQGRPFCSFSWLNSYILESGLKIFSQKWDTTKIMQEI